MVNKPLVTGTNLQGTLTYNDPQPYNYQEALDTLNLILSMKGMTLMEDGLPPARAVQKTAPIALLRILRGLDQIGDVRPRNRHGRFGSEEPGHERGWRSRPVHALGCRLILRAGPWRGLIVTDRLASIQRIRSCWKPSTHRSPWPPDESLHPLHASGAVVADLINRTFGSATAAKRTQFNPQTKQMDILPADPNDYVTAVRRCRERWSCSGRAIV